VAVGYLRVARTPELSASVSRPEAQEITLEAQRAAIEAWAARQGIAVATWKADEGVSGVAPIAERPGLLAAYGAVRELGAGVLVAAQRDRFACDVFVAGLVEQAALASGALLLTADAGAASGVDRASLDAPQSAAQASWTRGAVDLFVAYQRAMNRARTRAALAAKKARGERVGAVPYGYRLAADGLHLEAEPAEQAVLARVRQLSAAGLSQREIVLDLAAHGVVGRTGAPLQKTQIARMLRLAA
jgi:DNA invertase Pin-like site-specific DNA recombinase